jgi:hypothetical protein
MALFLNNRSSEILNVSLLKYDPSCKVGGQPWRKEGWWVLNPGQTLKPDAFDVNLTTVNGWAGVYAYTASGDKDWQGTGNAWFEVTGGNVFNQCGEDETNCKKWVDFYGVLFGGAADYITYIGPNANQIAGHAPFISITAGYNQLFGPSFYISGFGFVPGTKVTIGWEYVYGGGLAENLAATTLVVGGDGTFSDIIGVYWITYPGTLNVIATDSAWNLTAKATTTVS